MSAAILTIGTELTRGELVDTNATWLASSLTALGFTVGEIATVDDDREHIRDAIRRLAAAFPVLLVTGGLGPTTDDMTAESAAAAAGVLLTRDAGSIEAIRRRLATLGRALTASNEKQADVPLGAEVLGNPAGTAPAFKLRIGSCDAFFLPGVPREMRHIFEELIVPRIGPLASADSYQIVLRTYGLPESLLGERLDGLEAQYPTLTIGYRASYPEVEVKIFVRNGDRTSSHALAEVIANDVRARLGDHVYGEGDDTFAGAVGRGLRARGFTLAVAESCTGGLIGALLTSVAGSSDYLLVDAVTYSNSAKERLLGVPAETLIAHGAVSPECVRAMADGVRRMSSADVAIAVTGIAGPSGGSAEKPVGLVHFAIVSPTGVEVTQKVFPGDRQRVQRGAAYFALGLVRAVCAGPVSAGLVPGCG